MNKYELNYTCTDDGLTVERSTEVMAYSCFEAQQNYQENTTEDNVEFISVFLLED